MKGLQPSDGSSWRNSLAMDSSEGKNRHGESLFETELARPGIGHHCLSRVGLRLCPKGQMTILSGLVIDEPWVSMITSGEKTWEMRPGNTPVRERIALVRKGWRTV